MSTKKIYDLAVKTGTYTNAEGDEKGRYLNVGAIMQKDDGGKFIFINRTFNPAGVPNPNDRDNLILSMFEPKPRDGVKNEPEQVPPLGDDDIPF